jgi:S-formylglutathione hydrolase FrmB
MNAQDPSVRVLRHRSRVLEGNPLGDPVERDVIVCLPRSYDAQPARRYPTMWFLAGFGSSGAAFVLDSPVHEPLSRRLHRLAASGEAPEVIAVLPDCSTRFGGSQYIDSPGTGNYQQYLADELVPFIDAHFRTEAEPGRRAVVGRSSGGYGAWMAAARRPDVFRLAGCLAPDCGFEHCYFAFLPQALSIYRDRGGYRAFARDPLGVFPKDGAYMLALSLVAMATCYSPSPDSPDGFDFPMDPDTGELRDQVWERWKAFDPVRLVASQAETLRGLGWLYIDVGHRDEYYMHWGARALHARLDRLGVGHHYLEHPGGHQGIDARYEPLMRSCGQALAR